MGHRICEGNDNNCKGWRDTPSTIWLARQILKRAGIALGGIMSGWTDQRVTALAWVVSAIGGKFAKSIDPTAADAFRRIYGGTAINWGDEGADPKVCGGLKSGGCTSGPNQINFWSLTGQWDNDEFDMTPNFVHEFGHAYDHSLNMGPRNGMPASFVYERDSYLRSNDGGVTWQQNNRCNGDGCSMQGEAFADTFIASVYDAWNTASANAFVVMVVKAWIGNWVP